MTNQRSANVKSTDPIEEFRTRLVIYLSKMRPLLDDAQDEVLRTREWMRSDRSLHWENELKRRSRALEQAQQALFAAQFSNLRETSSAELLAVERAKRAVVEAQEKLRIIKKWGLEFEHQILPLLKHLEQLRTTFSNELPKGAEYLTQVIQAIEGYMDSKPQTIPTQTSSELDSASEEPPARTEPQPRPSKEHTAL